MKLYAFHSKSRGRYANFFNNYEWMKDISPATLTSSYKDAKQELENNPTDKIILIFDLTWNGVRRGKN